MSIFVSNCIKKERILLLIAFMVLSNKTVGFGGRGIRRMTRKSFSLNCPTNENLQASKINMASHEITFLCLFCFLLLSFIDERRKTENSIFILYDSPSDQ